MPSPVKINFKVYQGSTFKEVLRWESSTKVYKTITNITKAAPCVITAAGHALPLGWRTKVTNVLGMKEINSGDTYYVVTEASTNDVTLNSVNSLSYSTYTSGGVLEYNAMTDLTGYTSRMQLRNKITDTAVLLELTTENGGITLNPTLGTITINIAATQTALLSFSSAVYSLEMVKAGEVTQLVAGTITLEKEVTR